MAHILQVKVWGLGVKLNFRVTRYGQATFEIAEGGELNPNVLYSFSWGLPKQGVRQLLQTRNPNP